MAGNCTIFGNFMTAKKCSYRSTQEEEEKKKAAALN
jgi:hypothetical protein